MLLDLAESLACPGCGPPQGVVVLVERMEDGRVRDGRLDCPSCGSRYPLAGGSIAFGSSDVGGSSPEPPRVAAAEEDAIAAAALLGIRHGRGLLVVGAGLAPAAERIGELTGGCEVLLLGPARASLDGQVRDPAAGEPTGRTVTALTYLPPGRIPVLSSRATGVVLDSGDAQLIEEALRVAAPGGRIVVLRPTPEMEEVLSGPSCEILAADPRAIVARRT